MKVLFLHFASESRDAKAARLAKSGAQLIVEEPRWPRFSEVARREKPAAIVIDFSKAPSHALETADYISKAKDTRELELFAIHVFDDRRELLKERVPKIQVFSERELSAVIADRLPKWEAARAAAEEAAREERAHRAEERKAAAAASRSQARERRMALKASATEASAGASRPEPAKEDRKTAKAATRTNAPKAAKAKASPAKKKAPERSSRTAARKKPPKVKRSKTVSRRPKPGSSKKIHKKK